MADGNFSSRGHTSSPSPSASTSTPDNKPKKRTRASKPKISLRFIPIQTLMSKVISKIRRVKCGEEKPACSRCTSTGRTCDGYDNGTPLRNRTPQESLQEAELKRAEFLRTYQWSESVRSMRPIVADIDGTEMEKKFFHRFRTATEDNLTAHHMCTFTSFWTRLAPRITHHDEAVKHAAIALGAAHQLYQPSNDAPLENPTPEDIEVFIIQQYNKSISKLQRHVGSSSPESIKVTLVCCLAYICLETLRSSHQAVVTHLLNGLKILQSLPPGTFDFLAEPNAYAPIPRDAASVLDSSPFEMAEIIRIFGKLECSACFFVPGIRPVVAEHGYKHRRFDDGSREIPFPDLRTAQSAIVCFTRDVVARVYQVGTVTEPYYFWADMSQQRQQACLRERSKRLETLLINDFLTRPGALPGTGAPDKPETLCFYINLLHFRSAQLLLNGLDQSIPMASVPSSPSHQTYAHQPQTIPSPWQHQSPFQLPHHPRPAPPSSENLFYNHNLDPRLAAHTLVQMHMDAPTPQYNNIHSSYNSSEETLALNSSSRSSRNNSMPTTPGGSSMYNHHHHHHHHHPPPPPQNHHHLPFPFLVFSTTSSSTRPPATPSRNSNNHRLLHEIIHIAEIIHTCPSTRRFRELIRRGGNNNQSSTLVSGSSGTDYSSEVTFSSSSRRPPYSYAFTSDTGLLGPLSLVALVSSSALDGDGDEQQDGTDGIEYGGGLDKNWTGRERRGLLRKKALGMLKEYVFFGDVNDGRNNNDSGSKRKRGGLHAAAARGSLEDIDGDGEEEDESLTTLRDGEEGPAVVQHGVAASTAGTGDGAEFWVEYFGMLGFVEVLTPGAEHVVMSGFGL
ncbi:hypothetical protein V8F33_003031 [Rhypophila sp. PSN 637]